MVGYVVSTNINVSLAAAAGHPTCNTKLLSIESKALHPSVAFTLKV